MAFERYTPTGPGPVAPSAGLPWQRAQSTGVRVASVVPRSRSCFTRMSLKASAPWHFAQLISSEVGMVVFVAATTAPPASFTVTSTTW